MKRTLVTLSLAITAALSFTAAHAAELDYSYIEGGYSHIEADGGSDASGWGVAGSAAITSNLHLFGGYTAAETDSFSIDADIWRFGLGWNTGVTYRSDLVVRANYLQIDTDFPGPTGEADGYEAEVGLRTALTPNFETSVALGYIDIDRGNSSGDLYGKLGAQYKFNPAWGIAASATLSEDANEYFIGPRFSF